jgi:phosphoglycolate phosphatase
MFRVLRTIPTHDLRLIVFDLDGTLIDSRKDLAESVNAMLGRFGFARQPEEQIAGYIGNGAGVLVEKSLAAAGAKPGLAEAGITRVCTQACRPRSSCCKRACLRRWQC